MVPTRDHATVRGSSDPPRKGRPRDAACKDAVVQVTSRKQTSGTQSGVEVSVRVTLSSRSMAKDLRSALEHSRDMGNFDVTIGFAEQQQKHSRRHSDKRRASFGSASLTGGECILLTESRAKLHPDARLALAKMRAFAGLEYAVVGSHVAPTSALKHAGVSAVKMILVRAPRKRLSAFAEHVAFRLETAPKKLERVAKETGLQASGNKPAIRPLHINENQRILPIRPWDHIFLPFAHELDQPPYRLCVIDATLPLPRPSFMSCAQVSTPVSGSTRVGRGSG